MPAVPSLVDVEAVLVAHLSADTDLEAVLGDDRLGTELPAEYDHRDDDTAAKWLWLFRVGGSPVDAGTGHVDRALVQVHAYAGDTVDAFAVMAAAHRALYGAARAAHAAGVVTSVERVTGPARNADPTSGAPRYSATYAVVAHPHRAT